MIKEKQLLFDAIVEQIKSSSSFALVEYGSIGAMDSVRIRKSICDIAEMEVVPKRLFHKAMSETGIEVDMSFLTGNVAAVFVRGEELPQLIKVLLSNTKPSSGFKFLCSWMDGNIYGPKDTLQMATLPSKDVMRSKLLGALSGVASRSVTVLSAPSRSILYCFNAGIDKKEVK